ncbi:MAG: HEPN domain-containing protein [Actinobacteria bacterium]|jgi:HEPN domain-containing protein|nr:MAG: HEPN domain-containing protein [Actinomycetota bacterium]
MVRKTNRKPVDRSDSRNLLKKAVEARATMHSELEKGDFNSAASSAVKCAINACNALTVAVSGEISSGKKHEDAAFLLVERVRGKDVKEAENIFRRIVGKKTDIDYGIKLARKGDAESIVINADEFLEWVEGRMPPEYR